MDKYLTSRLSAGHDVSGFDCGKQELNEWLTERALDACESDLARVHVWTQEESMKVLAYFALMPTELLRGNDPKLKLVSGGASKIPGYLIGKLALDLSLQKHERRFGTNLLLNAVENAVGAAEVGGGRLIVVDAKDDDAFEFYKAHSFIPVRDTPNRLVMKVATARKVLGVGVPADTQTVHAAG